MAKFLRKVLDRIQDKLKGKWRVIVVWRDNRGVVTRTLHNATDLDDALDWAEQYDSTDTVVVMQGARVIWQHDGLRFGRKWSRPFKHVGSI